MFVFLIVVANARALFVCQHSWGHFLCIYWALGIFSNQALRN